MFSGGACSLVAMPVRRERITVAASTYHHTIIPTSPGSTFDPLAAACALGPLIAATADEAEANRRFPKTVFEAMAEARIFRAMVPRAAGGDELDPITVLDVVEAISRMDGSAGWLAMIGSGAGFLSGYLEADVATAIFEAPQACLCGNLGFPGARAVRVSGGYRVTGRWPFVSGCEHSTWISGNALVFDDDSTQCVNADGSPSTRIMLFPREAITILDTWSATGLRATTSHDVTVDDLFVPEEHSFAWSEGPTTRAAVSRSLHAYYPRCSRAGHCPSGH